MKNKKKKNKVGRPPVGDRLKIVCSFRIEEKFKVIIINKFGSIQKWIDWVIDEIKKSD